MHHKNIILATTITTLLSTNVGYAGDLTNWPFGCYSLYFPKCPVSSQMTGLSNTIVITFSHIFGTHLFGSSAVVLPSGTDHYFGARYKLVGEVDFPFEFKVTLSNGAQFAGTTTRLEFISETGNTSIQNGPYLIANCDSKSTCQWSISPTSTTLKNGDTFYLFYKIKNAQVLAKAGEKITLTAQLGTTFTPALIDTQEVTVAIGREPIEITFEPATDTGIRISAASQNTAFSSKTSGSPEFINSQTVTMGYLKISPILNIASDGFSTFNPGFINSSFWNDFVWNVDGSSFISDVGFDSSNKVDTSLTITGGQFAASVTGSTGKVYLDLDTAKCPNVPFTSSPIEADEVDKTNATWRLSNSDLRNLQLYTTSCQEKKVPIVIKTDGTTAINIVEEAPTATFLLDYAEPNNFHDIPYGPTELSKFKSDGTVCWVYNVPGSGAADILSLRITNESSVPGTVNGTLYDKDGNQIFPAADNPPLDLLGGELAVGETKAIFSSDLENLEGGPYTWPQRGMLQITSTLPRLEILSLLRSILPGSPLTNLSVGASGEACTN